MYVSNTLAGTSVQTYFESDGDLKKGRIYYKIFNGGCFKYSLMISNTTDSTFGIRSDCNFKCGEWKIHSIKAGRVSDCAMETASEPEKTIFGGHPNNEGGRVWAESLYEYVKNIII